MTGASEIESLKSENQKLRKYISLISAEIELSQRVKEIKENFTNSDDSEHIITPIMDRIFRIKSEKLMLQKELNID
ncbi:MAG: hypothetical protein KJN83_04425 [Nitrosopumilus sp.]|nr:hypothetical protein [Nitrosopumilus sp.]